MGRGGCGNLFLKIFGEIRDPKLKRKPAFAVVAKSSEEEDEYDLVIARQRVHHHMKTCGMFASVMNLIKAALGAGVMGGHVAYQVAGLAVAIPLNVILAIYLNYCTYILLWSNQRLCRRAKVASMTYADLGEAAFSCYPSLYLQKVALHFRYCIDATIMLDLFGSCATYQIIMAKTAKQLFENTQVSTIEGSGSYPHFRVYLIALLLPTIGIALITHLKWLAPLSAIGNLLILVCLGVVIWFAFLNNPHFENFRMFGNFSGMFQYLGMIIFSMSNCGFVIPMENHMTKPYKFLTAVSISNVVILVVVMLMSFFGYMAFLDEGETPITANLPMTLIPNILKGLMGGMMYISYAVNFWPPFELCWHYLKHKYKSRFLMWESIYRTIIVTLILLVAIIFPTINSMIGFLGCFCITNMAMIWPNLIYLLVIWEKPGLGKFKWQLVKGIILIIFGIIILIAGSIVNMLDLIKHFEDINLRSPSGHEDYANEKPTLTKISSFL